MKEVVFMQNDIIINKCATIERCIKRIEQEYDNNYENLKNFTKQDSIILNIQRACEACIDLAMHIVSIKGLGIPQKTRDAFDILCKNDIISELLSKKMKSMVGFRNIAIHDYQELSLSIINEIIKKHLNDFTEFTSVILSI